MYELAQPICLQFGLWVEPEMISVDSQLYQAHPEWAVKSPDRAPSFGREQLVLDMANRPLGSSSPHNMYF